jgi:biopolymer transport protein ExbB/TolQ
MPHPKRGIFTQGFIVQNVGLIFAVLAIGLLYSQYIRPKAEDIEQTRIALARSKQEPAEGLTRSPIIIVKDYEQQICFTLMTWATILLTYKLWLVGRERRMLEREIMHLSEGERILPDDALEHHKEIESRLEKDRSSRDRLLPAFVLTALQRFHATRSIQDSAASIQERSQLAADELESDLSLVRYIAWAIPSVGFIGTVRGIGDALAQADKALQGDLTGVTNALGLAFNSTLIALVLSIILMFMMHLLQSRQEHLIQDLQSYCRSRIIDAMKVPAREDSGASFV